MNNELADLIEAQEILAALDSPACQRVASGLHRILTETVDPHEALGIPKRGKNWHAVNRTRARDALIKKIGDLFYNERSKAALGRAIHRDFIRYEADVWPRTRHLTECPHPPGTKFHSFWRILVEYGGAPGWDSLRRLW
jgi:hypothetical protein